MPEANVPQVSRVNLIPLSAGCLGLCGFATSLLSANVSRVEVADALVGAMLSLLVMALIGAAVGWVLEAIVREHAAGVLQRATQQIDEATVRFAASASAGQAAEGEHEAVIAGTIAPEQDQNRNDRRAAA